MKRTGALRLSPIRLLSILKARLSVLILLMRSRAQSRLFCSQTMSLHMSCLSRLPTSRLQSTIPLSSTCLVSPFFLPFLYPNSRRNASILSSLHDAPGAFRRKRRAGRGPSSGKGKTSGRGHKGQKQHGKVPAGFNGGQTPLEVVHGTRGFKNK